MARIAGLDVARGVAILGTLATNIWIFSHPGGMLGYIDSPTTPGAGPGQQVTEAVLQQLANGKFLGLLTIMFGIGLAIQHASAARRGRPWPGPYLWRAALLLVDGVINYFLVIEFDVLMGYAVTAGVVALILARTRRAQQVWLVVTASLHVLLITFITWALFTGRASSGGGASAWGRPNPYADGSWWDLVLLRVDGMATFRTETALIALGSIALFLLGVRLYRAGLFAPERAALRRSLLVIGAVALVLDLSFGLADARWMPLTRWVIAPLVSLGLLALVATLTQHRIGWVGRRCAEVGRVALSGYFLQNLLASALFYGWGLGLNALPPEFRLGATVAAWIGIGALVCGFAHLWLGRFERGPVEWLWARGYEALSRTRSRPTPVEAPAGGRESAVAGSVSRTAAGRSVPRR